MRLKDIDTGREFTLPELHRDWRSFRAEDPVNHADDFTTELYEILMATVNGRNDCHIVGLTPSETCDYIISIRNTLKRRNIQ